MTVKHIVYEMKREQFKSLCNSRVMDDPPEIIEKIQKWLLQAFDWKQIVETRGRVYHTDISGSAHHQLWTDEPVTLYGLEGENGYLFETGCYWRYAFPDEESFCKLDIKPFWEDEL